MKIKKQIKKVNSIFSKEVKETKTYDRYINSLKDSIVKINSSYSTKSDKKNQILSEVQFIIKNIIDWQLIEKKIITDKDTIKAILCSQTLLTKQGRTKLAESMAEAIRTKRDYQSLGRKLFSVEPLSEGIKATYEKNIKR